MNIIINLAKRNIKLYLRNKSAIFFSFLSMMIIIILYALFLADINTQQLINEYGTEIGVKWLINSWIMGGIVTINTINITMASLAIMVEDKERNYIKDFIVAPIKRSHILLGYILSSIILGFIMTFISFIIAEIYIVLDGGYWLSLIDTIKVIIGIIFSVITISSITFFAYTFINSEKAISIISAIVGTLIGFLAGIYLPIGLMPNSIQKLTKFIPISYSATIFKSTFTKAPSLLVFKDIPRSKLYDYNLMMGNIITINNKEVSYITMIGILILTSIIFYLLSIIRIKKQKY